MSEESGDSMILPGRGHARASAGAAPPLKNLSPGGCEILIGESRPTERQQCGNRDDLAVAGLRIGDCMKKHDTCRELVPRGHPAG